MIGILEKYEHNTDFHQTVDFVEAFHLRYALTINPTAYVSHIRQFWSTARIETTDEGTKILATVDGKPRTISESSIRRNLKLRDKAGISSLPGAELFENLTLMGYNILPNQKFSFQKGQFSHQWKYLIHAIIARIAQSSALPTAADEPVSPSRDDSQGEACPIDYGLEAEQDRANIAKTSTLTSDSTPRVTSLAADKGSMQQKLNELTDLYTRLQRQQDEMALKITTHDLEISALKAKIKHLEDRDGGDDHPSGEDATIKGKRLETGEEADVASVLSSGVQVSVPPVAEVSTVSIPPAGEIHPISVPTGSGVVPTASPIFTTSSGEVPTASPIFTTDTVATPCSRRKGKEKMLEEEMERDAQRMNEQIARDAEIARIYAEEELQIMIDGLDRNNETVDKQLCKSSQVLNSAKKAPFKEATKRVLYVSTEEPCWVEDQALQGDDTGRNKREALVKETLNIKQAANDKDKELWVELKWLFESDVEDQL
uniref:Synaptobrevin, longin-like domain protein n=1 Tax=Tanacetum cinerariifolium TaxID=118510 RepID=A0A6L2L5N4_TANCI|nr:hypothetical protein [Tanacetum cinerariifolium]